MTAEQPDNLTLRSGRRPRLEGWATPRLVPTLRDAPLRGAPQGEVVLNRLPYHAPLEWRAPSVRSPARSTGTVRARRLWSPRTWLPGGARGAGDTSRSAPVRGPAGTSAAASESARRSAVPTGSP